MYRILYYTDMHGVDYLPPTEDRDSLHKIVHQWIEAYEAYAFCIFDNDLAIPAREIRYMQIEEV